MASNNNNNNSSSSKTSSKKHARDPPNTAEQQEPQNTKRPNASPPSIAQCIMVTQQGHSIPRLRGYVVSFNKPGASDTDSKQQSDKVQYLDLTLTDGTATIRCVCFGSYNEVPTFAVGTCIEISSATAKNVCYNTTQPLSLSASHSVSTKLISTAQLNSTIASYKLASHYRVHNTELDIQSAYLREVPNAPPMPHILACNIFCMVEYSRASFLLKVTSIGRPGPPRGEKFQDQLILEVSAVDSVGQAVHITLWGSHVAKVTALRDKFYTYQTESGLDDTAYHVYLDVQWARVAVRRGKDKKIVDDGLARISINNPVSETGTTPPTPSKKVAALNIYFPDDAQHATYHQAFLQLQQSAPSVLLAKELQPTATTTTSPVLVPVPQHSVALNTRPTSTILSPAPQPTNNTQALQTNNTQAPQTNNNMAQTLQTLQTCLLSLTSIMQNLADK